MTTLLVDTSVVLKWFHHEYETEVAGARAVLDAARQGTVEPRVIDLAHYELGNILLRSLQWDAGDVADQLDDLVVICGAPLAMTPDWLRRAATLGATHRLTFYDAAWAAAAQALSVPLVSADAQLLAAGLAESPATLADRLRLP